MAKATYVAISGLTDVNGQISMSRSFISDQPVEGRVRKSSTAPYYTTADVIDTIDSENGLEIVVELRLDQ